MLEVIGFLFFPTGPLADGLCSSYQSLQRAWRHGWVGGDVLFYLSVALGTRAVIGPGGEETESVPLNEVDYINLSRVLEPRHARWSGRWLVLILVTVQAATTMVLYGRRLKHDAIASFDFDSFLFALGGFVAGLMNIALTLINVSWHLAGLNYAWREDQQDVGRVDAADMPLLLLEDAETVPRTVRALSSDEWLYATDFRKLSHHRLIVMLSFALQASGLKALLYIVSEVVFAGNIRPVTSREWLLLVLAFCLFQNALWNGARRVETILFRARSYRRWMHIFFNFNMSYVGFYAFLLVCWHFWNGIAALRKIKEAEEKGQWIPIMLSDPMSENLYAI